MLQQGPLHQPCFTHNARVNKLAVLVMLHNALYISSPVLPCLQLGFWGSILNADVNGCVQGAAPEQAAAAGTSRPWDSNHEMQSHARAAKRQAAPYSTMSRTSAASSVEPFSDDDDVTILDTTEVKKLSPQPLMPLPEGQLPDALQLIVRHLHCRGLSQPSLQPKHSH